MVEFPNQRVSRSEKEQDSFYKPTYDHIINRALNLNKKDDITAWLDAANGMISNTSLNYLVSPLKDNETEKTIGKLPGEIRDTDLINTVRERNIGEYIGLPYKFTVTVHNADAVLRRDLEIADEANKIMQQALINMLNEYYDANQEGINTGVVSKEVPDIEEFVKDKTEKWIDDRATRGLNILKLINNINDFDSKRIQSFFYWWACEEFYTYREVINNEVYTSVISPLEGYPVYNNEAFVEDYTAFVIKKKITLTQLKNLYWNELSNIEKEHINHLSKKSASGSYVVTGEWLSRRNWDTTLSAGYSTNSTKEYDVTDNTESLDEYTIIWRTEVPIKIRKFIDPFGNEQEEIVSDEYTRTEEDINITTEWIEEIYIGKRFGNEISGVYLKPVPCDVQRYDKHTMTPKLPVGGKKGILRNIKQNPIPKRLTQFVIIDRLLNLVIERTIAKYEGYIKLVPQSMMNDDLSGTKNEKMFYIKADNTLIYDDTVVDFNTVAQGYRVIGMPDIANYIKTLIEIRDKYKAEGLEMANMNSYALGDVMASTGKGVMQESIYRAKVGNVLSITMFHAALEKDHQADLEFSKIAYKDGKRGSFVEKGTGKSIYVDVNIYEHPETDYGIFVENSKIDQEKIDAFRQLAFNASQNGDIDSAVAAIELDSVPELRQALKEISIAQKELNAKIENDKNETAKYVTDAQTARQDGINETAITVAEINADAAIDAANIRSQDTGTDSVPDSGVVDNDPSLKRDQLTQKTNDANRKNDLKERQLRVSERMNEKKLKLAANKPKGAK